MRKKALKKKYPERHKWILSMRSKNLLNEIILSNGKTVYLNLTKHLLYNRPYKHWEYNNEMNRYVKYHFEKLMKENKHGVE